MVKVKLDIFEGKLLESVKASFKNAKNEFSASKVWLNIFSLACRRKFEKAPIDVQRKVYKIMDKLEEAKNEVELSEEQFDFMYDTMTKTDLPLDRVIVEIADALDVTKIESKKTK